MKISDLSIIVDEIPEAGLVLQGSLEEAWVQPSLLPPYRAEGPLSVHLEVRRVAQTVLVDGRAQVALGFDCSRTLEAGHTTLELSVSELFQRGERHELNLEEGIDSDELDGDEPWLIESGKVELEPLLRETLVLAQDPYPIVVPRPAGSDETRLWASEPDGVDPRWAALQDLELS